MNIFRKTLSSAIYKARIVIWRILGFKYPVISKAFKYSYLSEVEWVSIGVGTYDNGAIVWRWSPDEHLIIGKYCSIAHGVHFLCGGGHHNFKEITTFPLFRHLFGLNDTVTIKGQTLLRKDWDNLLAVSKGPITVGNDVWIGLNCILLPGVTIGDGAVIMAGSVVVKDAPPYAICAGTPAKVISYRFDDSIIHSLIKLAWWNWPECLIKERISDFYDDVSGFISKYDK